MANVVVSAGAEIDTTGWFDIGASGIVSRDATVAHSGVASIKAVTPAVFGVGVEYRSPVVGGIFYELSVWAFFPAGRPSTAILSWRTAAGAELSNVQQAFVGTGAWQEMKLSGIAPNGTTQVFVDVVQGSAVAQTFWVDDLTLGQMSVSRAVTNGWVSWAAYNVGLLSFDHSLFNGTDVFGVSPLDASFGGTYDDIGSKIAAVNVTRGRSSNLDVVVAGAANVDLRDPNGIFNPDNTASPLYGQLEDRLHPIKLTDTFAGVTYGLFYGWVRRFHWQPKGRKGITQLECVDLFYWLDRANPIIAATGATTTGAAIGKILDAIGANDTAMRDLDTGDTIPDFSADGTQTGLQLIQKLLEAERGVFFIAGNGKATYRSRLARLTKPSAATITDKMSGAAPGVDWDQAYTRITVQRLDPVTGAVTYTAIAFDPSGVAKVGYNDMPPIQTKYLTSNAQADALATWILSQNTSPKPPLRDFTIDNREAAQLTQLLARDLVDRITVNAARGGTSGDFHIDSMNLTIDGKSGAHTMAWLLSKASTTNPAVFDTADFSGAYQFVL